MVKYWRSIVAVAGLTSVILVSSAMAVSIPKRITAKLFAGWDKFTEPLDFTYSNVVWTLNPTAKTLNVSFFLVNAQPRKLYQVGAHFFCSTFPAAFGQIPNDNAAGGTCETFTRQSVTKQVAKFEFGVVTTDTEGNGRFDIEIGPIDPATYRLQFVVRDGAGCMLTGDINCDVDFQSTGATFGTATTIIVP